MAKFGDGGGVRRPFVVGLLRAERDDEVTARLEEVCQFSEGSFPRRGWDVHPDPVQQNEVELVIEVVHGLQGGEVVVNPLDARRRMMILCAPTKSVSRFNGDYLMILFGKPGSVAPRSGSDVENQELRAREKGEPVRVDFFSFDLFVSLEKVCVAVIDRHF